MGIISLIKGNKKEKSSIQKIPQKKLVVQPRGKTAKEFEEELREERKPYFYEGGGGGGVPAPAPAPAPKEEAPKMTTPEYPTPSAETLRGTTEQREQQIKAYRETVESIRIAQRRKEEEEAAQKATLATITPGVKAQEEKKSIYEKIMYPNIFGFIDKTYYEVGRFWTPYLKKIVPGTTVEQKLLKKVLFSPSPIEIKPSEIGKFVLFSPAMATTPSALSSAIKRGDIVPDIQTEFKAKVTPLKKDVSKIDVIAKTEAGGSEVISISKQMTKDISRTTNIGTGKVFSVEKGTGKITKGGIIGGARQLGKARYVIETSESKISTALGKGIETKTFVKETEKGISRAGLRVGVPKFMKEKIIYPKIIEQKAIGFIKPTIQERVYGFVGTTKTPITKISKEGITKIIYPQDINIRGLIKFQKSDIESISKTGGVLIQKTKIIPLSKTTIKEALKLSKISETKIISEAASIKSIPKFSIKVQKTTSQIQPTQIQPTQKIKPSTTSITQEITTPTYKTIPALKTTPTFKEKEKTKQKVKVEQITEQIAKQKIISGQKFKQKQLQKQKLIPRLQLRSKLDLKSSSFTIPKIPLIPKIPIVPPLFLFSLKGKKRKKAESIRKIAREDIGISEGFTAKVLGIKPIKISKFDIPKISSVSLRIRPAPIIK